MSRRFVLIRSEDETGVSGTGHVADGVQFGNGKCVLCWCRTPSSVDVYDDIDTLEKIHGHDGETVVKWVDPGVRKIVS
jgi:hypothetical protein